MHPDVVVALLQAAVIALAAVAVHEADIANFYVRAVLHDQTKTVEYGIGTNTLHGDASLCGVDHQITLGHVCRIGDVADKPQAQRTLFFIFLISRNDVLHTSHSSCTLAGGVNACRHGVLVGIGDIYHNGICFQRAVLVVCTGRSALYKAKAASVVSLYLKSRSFCCLRSIFLAVDYRHDLHGVAAGFQTYCISTETIRILAYQHGIQLSVAAACRLDIHVVAGRIGHSTPFRIGSFQVAAGIDHRHRSTGCHDRRNVVSYSSQICCQNRLCTGCSSGCSQQKCQNTGSDFFVLHHSFLLFVRCVHTPDIS